MVADLLARMPVYNSSELERQMEEMTRMGETGRAMILLSLKPSGSGDDTPVRFAVESYSRYLSAPDRSSQRSKWESECIAFFRRSSLPEIKEFMLSQLIYTGGREAAELAVENIESGLMCESSAALLMATGTSGVGDKLIALLDDSELSCAAGVMNCLSGDIANRALQQLIQWYRRGDQDEKRAAIGAISRAEGTDPYRFLTEAAEKNGFDAGYTGETDALINYAYSAGKRGESDVPAEVAVMLLRRPLSSESVHYRKAALTLLAEFQGEEALDQLIREFRSEEESVRRTAINLAGRIPGESVTAALCSQVKEMPAYIASDIITVIGLRGDRSASEPLSEMLFNSVPEIRIPGVRAYARLEGSESVETLIDYMRSYPYYEDQLIAVEALSFTADSLARQKVAAAIADSPPVTKANMIMFVASGGEPVYFPLIAQYCNSQNNIVSEAAYDALPEVSRPGDTEMLISMALQNSNEERVADLLKAIAGSVKYSENPANASELFSKRVAKSGYNRTLLSALPLIGDRRSAECILKAFEAGDAESRDFIYSLMEQWPRNEITDALYEIVASGNKSYQERAFREFCTRVQEGNIPGEQKLLLARRIEPWATSDERRLILINAVEDIRSFTGMVWLSGYLGKSDSVSQKAAAVIADIALPDENGHPGYTGEMAMEILQRAARVLKGGEKAAAAEAWISSVDGEEGFVSMFNGDNLDGWQGLVENPLARSRMTDKELAAKQKEADMEMRKNWSVDGGAIWFSGNGANLCSVEEYGDFEMLVDWRITKNGDSGIYLRGTPQV
jgi:HEAT repeat protein